MTNTNELTRQYTINLPTTTKGINLLVSGGILCKKDIRINPSQNISWSSPEYTIHIPGKICRQRCTFILAIQLFNEVSKFIDEVIFPDYGDKVALDYGYIYLMENTHQLLIHSFLSRGLQYSS